MFDFFFCFFVFIRVYSLKISSNRCRIRMEKTREICSTTGFYSSHLSSNKIQRTHINLSFTFLFIYARYRLVVFMAVVLFHSFILLQHILWSESFFFSLLLLLLLLRGDKKREDFVCFFSMIRDIRKEYSWTSKLHILDHFNAIFIDNCASIWKNQTQSIIQSSVWTNQTKSSTKSTSMSSKNM